MKCLTLLFLLFLSACRPDPILEGYTYTLQNSPLEITLSFDAHTAKYMGKAINRYFGTYTREGDTIHFSTPQSTMLAGDEDDMVSEETYLTDLSHVASYTLDENTLILRLPDGRQLFFSRRH